MRYIAQLAKYGRFTSAPADIHGSVGIGISFVIARATPKLVLASTVLFGAVTALSAGTAGIARIDSHEEHSGQPGLVLKEKAQLRESPGMQNCALLPQGRDPSANAVEVFNGNAAFGAFSFGNDLLANAVVDVRGEAPLFSGQLLQPPLRRTGLFLLKFRPQPAVTMAHRLDLRTGVALTIRIAGNISDTKIDTEKVCWLNGGAVRQVHRAIEIQPAFAVDQIGLTFDPVKSLLLVFAIDQRDDHSLFRQRPQADAVQSLEAHNAFVVSDGAVFPEHRTFRFVPREAFNSFTYRPDGHLCRQAVAAANFRVGQLVDRRLAEDFSFKSTLSREGSGFIDSLHSGKQPLALFGVRQNLQLERELHYYGVYHSLEREGAIPLPAKAGSLLAQNL